MRATRVLLPLSFLLIAASVAVGCGGEAGDAESQAGDARAAAKDGALAWLDDDTVAGAEAVACAGFSHLGEGLVADDAA